MHQDNEPASSELHGFGLKSKCKSTIGIAAKRIFTLQKLQEATRQKEIQPLPGTALLLQKPQSELLVMRWREKKKCRPLKIVKMVE